MRKSDDRRSVTLKDCSSECGNKRPFAMRTPAGPKDRLDVRLRLVVTAVLRVLDLRKGAEALGSLMIQMDDPWQGLRDIHLLIPAP